MVLQNVDHNTKGGKNLKIKVAGVKSNPTICAKNPALSFVNISTTINECEKMKIKKIIDRIISESSPVNVSQLILSPFLVPSLFSSGLLLNSGL